MASMGPSTLTPFLNYRVHLITYHQLKILLLTSKLHTCRLFDFGIRDRVLREGEDAHQRDEREDHNILREGNLRRDRRVRIPKKHTCLGRKRDVSRAPERRRRPADAKSPNYVHAGKRDCRNYHARDEQVSGQRECELRARDGPRPVRRKRAGSYRLPKRVRRGRPLPTTAWDGVRALECTIVRTV
jgi:hypothetical protein